MAVFYLDIDDEITSAAARLRSTPEIRVVLVLPAGSRLATSRINFRLLAREAQSHGRILSLVAPEASARALAMSAGLPVFATLADYEESVADSATAAARLTPSTGATDERPTGRGPKKGTGGTDRPGKSPGPGAGTIDSGSGSAKGREATTSGSVAAGAAAAGAASAAGAGPGGAARGASGAASSGGTTGLGGRPGPRSAGADRPAAAPAGPRGPRHMGRYVVAALVVLILAAGGVAAAQLLPSATITLTPRVETVGPISEVIRADPTVTAPDAAAGVVPAVRQSWDLVAQGVYGATGTQVTETAATGSVTFTNCDTGNAHTIPGGSIVGTASGIQFETSVDVFLPVAVITGTGNNRSVTCQSNSVALTAVVKGLSGNVAAGAINQVPLNQNKNVISVTNPRATAGGTHVETKVVAKSDTDAALKDLTSQLDAELAAKLADPTAVPAGLTVFPATQSLSTPVLSRDPATIIGKPLGPGITTFTLSATATGGATAVDQTTIQPLVASRLRQSVPSGYTLLDGSVTVQVGPGTVAGQSVTFTARAQGSQVRQLDASKLAAQVRGKSVGEASALLEAYGTVDIRTWPGFVTSVSGFDFRVQLTIAYPAAASPSPATSGSSPPPATSPGSVGSGASTPPGSSAGGPGQVSAAP